MDKHELKPCPCCASKDVGIRCEKFIGEPIEISGEQYWYIECLDCDMRTGDCFEKDAEVFGYKDGKEMVIARWNRRDYVEQINE